MNKVIKKKAVLPELNVLLKYENDDVVYKFIENYDVSYQEAKLIFNEMLKWLWLCGESNYKMSNGLEVQKLTIDNSLLILDEMWHTFILFTRSYTKFCYSHFNAYLHHGPTTYTEKLKSNAERATDPKKYIDNRKDKFRKQYSHIYDKLGEETLKTWYDYFENKYTLEFIKEIRK